MWQVEEIVKAVAGSLRGTPPRICTGVSTDSRTVKEGELFVPLKGPRFNGHDFIAQAFAGGAAASLCDADRDRGTGEAGPLILVEDTNRALLELAGYRRNRIDSTFIALTGSNGKTTTKELLARMMESTFRVAYNERNYNNRIGVSHTLLGIESDPSPDFIILELGTNNRGEIAELASLVRPDMSLITNINPSHLQGLGDVDGVFREKTDLFRATKGEGPLFLNDDDPYLSLYESGGSHPVYRFGMGGKADYTLKISSDKGLEGFAIQLGLRGETIDAATPLLGIHNLYNIIAASAIAHAVGVRAENIVRAIENFGPYDGRFRSLTSVRGFTVIDDTYNANPASMERAISTLLSLPCKGKKIAILGDMKELGEQTAYYHRELGRLLFRSHIPLILLLGEQIRVVQDEVKNGHALCFSKREDLLDHALKVAGKDDIILVKGSRALKMDGIVEGLL